MSTVTPLNRVAEPVLAARHQVCGAWEPGIVAH